MKQLFILLGRVADDLPDRSMAAQQVLGLVRDDQGNPIAAVNIAVDGAPVGVVTDRKGGFSLDLDPATVHYITFHPCRLSAGDGQSHRRRTAMPSS